MRNIQNYYSLPYNQTLREKAKKLRKAGILHEVLLWKQIKSKKLNNLDFDRQKIIGNYIVDFYCTEKSVVIEIDGSSHDNKQNYDSIRDLFLEHLGLTIIHLRAKDILQNIEGVVEFLKNHSALKTTPSLRDTPPQEGNYDELDSKNSPPSEGWQTKSDGVVL